MQADRQKPASLPAPDATSVARSHALAAHIRAALQAAGGWLPFSRYMEMALYTPQLGYYGGDNAKFGRSPDDGSDFITAPELTPLFGRALAQPVAEALALSGTRQIIEFGAGTGRLAGQLLNAFEAMDSDALPSRYAIVELSGELRQRQRATLERLCPDHVHRVEWLDRLPDAFEGVAVGNEVLDAMPVRLHRLHAAKWYERGVALNADGDFDWADRPAAAPAEATATPSLQAMFDELVADAADASDYLVESHEAAEGFIATVCKMLTRGAVFMIDYGFPRREYYHPQRGAGTLMCHFRHRSHGNPFIYPGLQDITAHVDFSGVAIAAEAAGARVCGYTSQARFLINAGLIDALSLADPQDAAHYLPMANAVQKLVSEAEMGELFKVIAFARGFDAPLSAFASGDRSASLFDGHAA